MRFTEKVAIVTGAGSGIGAACARRLAKEGASVALIDIDEAAAVREAAGLDCAAGGAAPFCCDVSCGSDVRNTVDAVVRAFGRIDLLVNNAGINRPADFLDLCEEDFDLVLRTNLKSVFLVGQAAARIMVDAGRPGAIVNMSSGNAVITGPRVAAYAASKGGIAALTKAMALSLAPHAIRVNAVGPGTIMTEMTRARLWDDEKIRRQVLSRTPLGRFGEAEEIASAVAFLGSDDSSYMTGQSIYVDGGRNALNYNVES